MRLVVVQSATGKLFVVDAATGVTDEIDLGGRTLPNGDGLLLLGRTLYVVQNRLNAIAVVKLAADLSSGRVTADDHRSGLRRPDDDRPVRQPPVRSERPLRQPGARDGDVLRRQGASLVGWLLRCARRAPQQSLRVGSAGRLAPWKLEAFQLVILRRPDDAPDLDEDTLARIQTEHLAHHDALRAAGQIVTNGPVLDQPDELFRGLAVYRVGRSTRRAVSRSRIRRFRRGGSPST